MAATREQARDSNPTGIAVDRRIRRLSLIKTCVVSKINVTATKDSARKSECPKLSGAQSSLSRTSKPKHCATPPQPEARDTYLPNARRAHRPRAERRRRTLAGQGLVDSTPCTEGICHAKEPGRRSSQRKPDPRQSAFRSSSI